jgi:hypothetical protein
LFAIESRFEHTTSNILSQTLHHQTKPNGLKKTQNSEEKKLNRNHKNIFKIGDENFNFLKKNTI